jgi:hypothetical protein
MMRASVVASPSRAFFYIHSPVPVAHFGQYFYRIHYIVCELLKAGIRDGFDLDMNRPGFAGGSNS